MAIKNPMTITMYTRPGCSQCKMTAKKFTQAGIVFDTKDVSESEEAYNEVVELGYQSLPVVVVIDESGESESWAGLRPEMIRAVTATAAA